VEGGADASAAAGVEGGAEWIVVMAVAAVVVAMVHAMFMPQ
jgi:hypothetical protein